jgi:hypothetical protein
MSYCRSSFVVPLTSSVIIPTAQKDSIDADIQLAGVKPMSCPNERALFILPFAWKSALDRQDEKSS